MEGPSSSSPVRTIRRNNHLDVRATNPDFLSAAFPESQILSPSAWAQLSAWYGRDWRLLYRGTRDGMTASDFHRHCDNKGSTLSVFLRGPFIFGGFSSVSWSSEWHLGWGNYERRDDKASLFSLVSPHSSASPVQLKVAEQKADKAVYLCKNWGPDFGESDLQALKSEGRVTSRLGSTFQIPQNVYRDTDREGRGTIRDAENGRGRFLFFGSEEADLDEMEVFGVLDGDSEGDFSVSLSCQKEGGQ
uniref:TLDc domain-containing protein n=1 Tax=Chromera velia CCMP2878 TaxID=1169474 RepID=A0A0G4H9E9_9ALVE|eukprot:Cvel_5981.t1-p1 / transcript=Cvel_5981.t1 / gene=Cvel_5981 / organism=Chromera_velia_CCMP2878 / gene_product=hypothetical protein / transcript_product=hypothetical protein / location=Cvel_scaffold286:75480-76293(+) / protein_length=245 / sequence_SO=supercontig / SO=protein_coding / is_pseudo=false